jgi:GNAT superfamily N-acetyltransferase
MGEHHQLTLRISPPVSGALLNDLFAAAWPGHRECDFAPVLTRSLAYICAYSGERLAGFVNLAWDGGIHAFILDTTVHPALQRRGVGTALVRAAAAAARERGIVWLHVDYEPHLEPFYRACGFVPTLAGLLRLDGQPPS